MMRDVRKELEDTIYSISPQLMLTKKTRKFLWFPKRIETGWAVYEWRWLSYIEIDVK